jgi:hypothetical protein
MRKMKNLLLVGSVLLVLGIVLNIMGGTSQLSASGSAPVTVVNTPLPVTAAQSGAWNVGISNTPGVNVANTPNVNIANTPTVALAPGVSIRDADNPARHAFQIAVAVQLAPGLAEATAGFPVPGGKELVIENVSGFGEIPIGESLTNVSVCTAVRGITPPNQGPPEICHFFVPTVTGSYNGTVNNNVVSAQPRLYSDGCDFSNCQVRVQANRNGTSGSGDFHFSISGYLADIP